MKQSYDEYADSDEDQHDAYLERMKEEGKIREENANDSSDGSGEETGEGGLGLRGCRGVLQLPLPTVIRSTEPSLSPPDESFNPGEEDDDVAEE